MPHPTTCLSRPGHDSDLAHDVAALHAALAHADAEVCEHAAWRHEAAVAVGHLIAARMLPTHLAISSEEPPVVVTRTVAAALRILGSCHDRRASTVPGRDHREDEPWASFGTAAS